MFGLKTPGTLTLAGAGRLVERIQRYWARRGKYPRVEVEREGDIFVIRSDMRGGQP